MPSDIVQVIDRAIIARQIARGECMCADAHGNMVAGGSCHDCKTADPDIAQLRALRDRIKEDREAWAARLNSNTSTAFMERMHATGDALLAFCREVGT